MIRRCVFYVFIVMIILFETQEKDAVTMKKNNHKSKNLKISSIYDKNMLQKRLNENNIDEVSFLN